MKRPHIEDILDEAGTIMAKAGADRIAYLQFGKGQDGRVYFMASNLKNGRTRRFYASEEGLAMCGTVEALAAEIGEKIHKWAS